jgi:hypothetical protein
MDKWDRKEILARREGGAKREIEDLMLPALWAVMVFLCLVVDGINLDTMKTKIMTNLDIK